MMITLIYLHIGLRVHLLREVQPTSESQLKYDVILARVFFGCMLQY